MIYKKILLLLLTVSLYSGEYEDWLKEQNNQYKTYKKSIDDEFSKMLKQQWKAIYTQHTIKAYKKPKPKALPSIKKEIKITKKDIKKSIKIKDKEIKKILIKEPIIVKIPKTKNGFQTTKFEFYGQDISIQYNSKLKFNLSKINKNTISDIWKHLGKVKINNLIKQIDTYVLQYQLNDWAKYLLLYNLGQNIYHDQNKTNIFVWFMLTKMKYDTKIGYKDSNIYLLSTVKEHLYQVAYFKMKNKRYYILTPNGKIKAIGAIFTYPSNYPNAKNKLSFDMNKYAINIYTNIKSRNLSFKFSSQTYNIKANYSQDLVKFYKTFPQSPYNLYFDSKKSSAISNTLLIELKNLVKGKTELEATNFLLRFVQTAFKYQTDDEQFGNEKIFFPEETIAYPYSDCEDRSIIFSYLIKSIIGLDVVALKYPNHLSTAVSFNTDVKGSGFTYDGKRYIISDPTYINANVGMSMPKYRNSSFTIIP